MQLPATTQVSLIEILAPRWKDKTVLIADWKVGPHNKIVIKAKKQDGSRYFPEPFYMSGEKLQTYPTQPHATRSVYIVPLDDLEVLEQV